MENIKEKKLKGRKIIGYDIEGTRPTMDRVKESLFAMIQSKLKESKVLDLFTGSGNLGLESFSNGASFVTFVDKNKKAIQIVKQNIKELNITEKYELVISDYMNFLKNQTQKYGIIFLDPPYKANLLEKAVSLILENNLLEEDGIIVCEYENIKLELSDLIIWKERKYGTKMITIYKKK